jgi:hypothetical protein
MVMPSCSLKTLAPKSNRSAARCPSSPNDWFFPVRMKRLGRAVLVLALSACQDRPAPTASLEGIQDPTRDISDAVHNGGNARFYFLPPLVRAPQVTGMFDPSLSPRVVVCEWADSKCGAVIAQFTTSGGTGSESVRLDAVNQQYIVNWNTDSCITGACSLSSSKRYRLRVFVGALQLGFADVQVFASTQEAKNTTTGESISLVNGRTLPVKFRIEQGAVAMLPTTGGATPIGSTGGSTATADGAVALAVPSGALGTTTTLSIAPVPASTIPSGSPVLPGSAFEFGPDGTVFATPVTLSLAYDPVRLPTGVSQKMLRLHTLENGTWVQIAGSQVDPAAKTVFGPVSHFSSYAISPQSLRFTPLSLRLGLQQTRSVDIASAMIQESDLVMQVAVQGQAVAVRDPVSGDTTQGGEIDQYVMLRGSSAKSVQVIGVRTGSSWLEVSAPDSSQLPASMTLEVVPGKLRVDGLPASMVYGDAFDVRLTVLSPDGDEGRVAAPQTFALQASANLALLDASNGQPIQAVTITDQQASIRVKAVGGGAATLSIVNPNFDAYAASTTIGQPRISANPAGPNQLVFPNVRAGSSAQASIQILNSGVGTAGGLFVGSFFNYYNGSPYPWITGTLDRTTAPATLTFTVKPPAGYAPGTHTVKVTIGGAEGVYGIDYIFSFTIEAPRVLVYPAGPSQLVLPPAPAGGSSQASVQITSSGSPIEGLFVGLFFNNHNGEQYPWITGTFDRTTTPATLTFTASPPASLAPVTHSVKVTIGAGPGAIGTDYVFSVVVAPPTLAFFEQVSAANSLSCGLKAGLAYCWGAGNTNVPKAVPGGIAFTKISAGWVNQASCGLTTDGSAYCWGADWGSTPVPVQGGLRFKAIDAGGYQACGISEAGAAYCWNTATSTPTLKGGANFESVVANLDHACALTATGAAYCWGVNSSGQLGTGGTSGVQDTPLPVTGGHVFTQLSGGWEHTCGLTADGTAYCWGKSTYGELGNGAGAGSATPVAITERRFKTIGAGFYHTCGISTEGPTYCWGDDREGRLGRGFFGGATRTPSLVAGGKTFIDLATGQHNCAREANGATSCWGPNVAGEIGDGTTTNRASPVAVTPP